MTSDHTGPETADGPPEPMDARTAHQMALEMTTLACALFGLLRPAAAATVEPPGVPVADTADAAAVPAAGLPVPSLPLPGGAYEQPSLPTASLPVPGLPVPDLPAPPDPAQGPAPAPAAPPAAGIPLPVTDPEQEPEPEPEPEPEEPAVTKRRSMALLNEIAFLDE